MLTSQNCDVLPPNLNVHDKLVTFCTCKGFFIGSGLCRLFCSWSFIYFQLLVSSDVYGNALGVFWNTGSGSAWCCWFVRAVLLRPPMFGFKDEFFTSDFHHPSNVLFNMPGFFWDLKQSFALCIDVTKQRQKKQPIEMKLSQISSKSNQHLQFIPDIENYQHLPFHRCIHKYFAPAIHRKQMMSANVTHH